VTRRILIACAVSSVALGSVALAPAAHADCPHGTVPTRFEGVCVKGQGSAPPPAIIVPPQGADIAVPPGSAPTVRGIPCNANNAGTCRAIVMQG